MTEFTESRVVAPQPSCVVSSYPISMSHLVPMLPRRFEAGSGADPSGSQERVIYDVEPARGLNHVKQDQVGARDQQHLRSPISQAALCAQAKVDSISQNHGARKINYPSWCNTYALRCVYRKERESRNCAAMSACGVATLSISSKVVTSQVTNFSVQSSHNVVGNSFFDPSQLSSVTNAVEHPLQTAAKGAAKVAAKVVTTKTVYGAAGLLYNHLRPTLTDVQFDDNTNRPNPSPDYHTPFHQPRNTKHSRPFVQMGDVAVTVYIPPPLPHNISMIRRPDPTWSPSFVQFYDGNSWDIHRRALRPLSTVISSEVRRADDIHSWTLCFLPTTDTASSGVHYPKRGVWVFSDLLRHCLATAVKMPNDNTRPVDNLMFAASQRMRANYTFGDSVTQAEQIISAANVAWLYSRYLRKQIEYENVALKTEMSHEVSMTWSRRFCDSASRILLFPYKLYKEYQARYHPQLDNNLNGDVGPLARNAESMYFIAAGGPGGDDDPPGHIYPYPAVLPPKPEIRDGRPIPDEVVSEAGSDSDADEAMMRRLNNLERGPSSPAGSSAPRDGGQPSQAPVARVVRDIRDVLGRRRPQSKPQLHLPDLPKSRWAEEAGTITPPKAPNELRGPLDPAPRRRVINYADLDPEDRYDHGALDVDDAVSVSSEESVKPRVWIAPEDRTFRAVADEDLRFGYVPGNKEDFVKQPLLFVKSTADEYRSCKLARNLTGKRLDEDPMLIPQNLKAEWKSTCGFTERGMETDYWTWARNEKIFADHRNDEFRGEMRHHGSNQRIQFLNKDGIAVYGMHVADYFVLINEETMFADVAKAVGPDKSSGDFTYKSRVKGKVVDLDIPEQALTLPVAQWGHLPRIYMKGCKGGARKALVPAPRKRPSAASHVKMHKPKRLDIFNHRPPRPGYPRPSRKRDGVLAFALKCERPVHYEVPPEALGLPSYNELFVANERLGAEVGRPPRAMPRPAHDPFYRGREPDMGRMDDVRLDMGHAIVLGKEPKKAIADPYAALLDRHRIEIMGSSSRMHPKDAFAYQVECMGTNQLSSVPAGNIVHVISNSTAIPFPAGNFIGYPLCPRDRGPFCAPQGTRLRLHSPEAALAFAGTSFYQNGVSFPACLPGLFANSPHNHKAALVYRHLGNPAVLDDDRIAQRWLTLANDRFLDIVASMDPGVMHSVRDAINSCPPSKHGEMLSEAWLGIDSTKARNHRRDAFLKMEILCPSANCVYMKPPRLIQATLTSGVQSWFNVYSQWLSISFKKRLDRFLISGSIDDLPHYISAKGLTNVQLGAIFYCLKSNGYLWIEDDFSMFDATQGKGPAMVTSLVTHRLAENGADASQFLGRANVLAGKTDYYTYGGIYTRRSGDPHTSTWNEPLNWLSHSYCFSTMGIPVNKTFILAAGDDNLSFLPGSTDIQDVCARLPGVMAELGFISEPVVQDPPSFCSAYFVPMVVDGEPSEVLVPDIRRPLSKIGFSLIPTCPKRAFVEKAASISSMPVFRHLPLARDVVRGLLYGIVKIRDRSDAVPDNSIVTINPESMPDYKIQVDHDVVLSPVPVETDAAYLRVIGLNNVEADELGHFLEWVFQQYGGTACMVQHPLMSAMSQRWLGLPLERRLPVAPLPPNPHSKGLD